jgi:hypothetical protein
MDGCLQSLLVETVDVSLSRDNPWWILRGRQSMMPSALVKASTAATDLVTTCVRGECVIYELQSFSFS